MDEQSAAKSSVPNDAAPAGDQRPARPERAADRDLSQEIERAVEREPLDLVKCVRVFGNYYRCNWWSRPTDARKRSEYAWTGVIMDVIRKSSFLSATMQADELVIKVIAPSSASQTSAGGRRR
jgi:hypothetical protein